MLYYIYFYLSAKNVNYILRHLYGVFSIYILSRVIHFNKS